MRTSALAPVLTVILAVGVLIAAVISFRHASVDRAAKAVITVRGVVGSEKQALFLDPDVIAEFRRNGIAISVTTQGSREQAGEASLTGADFYFPAGEPAGRAIARRLNIKDASTPFFTPLLIASWTDIAQALAANGIVEKRGRNWYSLRMDRMLTLVESGRRWNQLPHNTSYDVGKAVLISSTDARKSNSADMYLALASYVFNGNSLVTTASEAHRIQSRLDALFLRQGFVESSSAGPFDDYVTIGEGKAPLVMCYEQQFVEYLASVPVAGRPRGMVALYPKPTIVTKHTLVPTDEAGRKIADLLQNDPVLRQAEIRHGFRNSDDATRRQFWTAHHIDLLDNVVDLIDPPSFETLESMIAGIERAYARQ